MATQIQLRRGTTAQHSTFTGAAGEITVDTDKNSAVIHNGSTAGGFPLAKESGSNINASSLVVTTGNVGIGTATPSSKLHIVGTTIIEEVLEKANVFSLAVGANTNFDVLDCAVQYYTGSANANTTLNIRGNSTVTLNSIMSVNQSLTISFIMTNGATAYRVANIQLDAVNTAIKWSGGSAPTACSNSAEAYAVTVIKTGTAAVYNIFASKVQFA